MARPITAGDGAAAALASPPKTSPERVVVEARDLHKSFRVPHHRVDSFKERALHPLTRIEYRELKALRGASFDVHAGEFFGIVGRNGSGKSTLLKILASIYRPDIGTVRMAGRLAPFIELGVGFDPELTARENTVLNGVLMGLTKREAQRRFHSVIEFAGLEEFVELKLKNYSSGMMVRLAFAVMVQADADIMLVDEVLAVGDAAFAQKCMDVFQQRRRDGKTIVLVTHDMATVQEMCDRAMLLHDGEMQYVGDPEETAMRYYRLNFATEQDAGAGVSKTAVPDFNAQLVTARLRDRDGGTTENLEQDQPIAFEIELEARRDLERPIFTLHVVRGDGTVVLALTRALAEGGQERVEVGGRVRLSGEIENALVPGSYYIDCWVRRDGKQGDMALQGIRVLDFVVYGTAPRHGLISVSADLDAVAEPARTL